MRSYSYISAGIMLGVLIVMGISINYFSNRIENKRVAIEINAVEIEELEAAITREAMQLRYGENWNFQNMMDANHQFFDATENFVSTIALPKSDTSLQDIRAHILNELESFKTNLSIERNSQAYVMRTVDLLINDDQFYNHMEALRALITIRSAIYLNDSSSYSLAEFGSDLTTVQEALSELNRPDLEAQVVNLEQHMLMLQQARSRLNGHLENSRNGFVDLNSVMNDQIKVANRQFDLWMFWSGIIFYILLATCALLVFFITHLISKLNNQVEYRAKENERLEVLVNQRTEKLEQATEAAELASHAKSEFLANMSHEIRTPLNGVLGMTQLMGRTSLNEKQQKFMSSLTASGEALLSIINNILDMSKIEAGLVQLDEDEFEIGALLKQSQDAIIGIALKKGVEVALNNKVPVQNLYLGDAIKIRQILINLGGNAIKFTDQGSVTLQSLITTDGKIRFEVLDTGSGIPENQLATLFDRFTQADSSPTKRHEGTGLGLAISSELVKLMGGEIGVQSKLEVGSCFWFELPLKLTSAETEKLSQVS